MNKFILSDKAKNELEKMLPHDSNWNSQDYLMLLKDLAERDIPNIECVMIKNQGKNKYDESVEEYKIASELKTYAEHYLAKPKCSAYKKLSEWVALDDFLEFLMRNTGEIVKKDRFYKFLAFQEESKYEENMELLPEKTERKSDFIARRIQIRWQNLQSEGVPKLVQCELQEHFSKWWKSNDQNNALNQFNNAKKQSVKERRSKVSDLLPSKNDKEGLTKEQLFKKAATLYTGMCSKTFSRDIEAMLTSGDINIQKDGKYRKIKKI